MKIIRIKKYFQKDPFKLSNIIFLYIFFLELFEALYLKETQFHI